MLTETALSPMCRTENMNQKVALQQNVHAECRLKYLTSEMSPGGPKCVQRQLWEMRHDGKRKSEENKAGQVGKQ